ncbi:hypothetical protein ANCCAN_29395, partial [Ancylostoma caninum]
MSSHDFLFNLQLQQFVQQLYRTYCSRRIRRISTDIIVHFLRCLSKSIRVVLGSRPPRRLDNLRPPLTPIMQASPDGGSFLQLQTPEMHIYYSGEVVMMARDTGMTALIGDGVHKLNPKTLNRMDKDNCTLSTQSSVVA